MVFRGKMVEWPFKVGGESLSQEEVFKYLEVLNMRDGRIKVDRRIRALEAPESKGESLD